MGDWETGCPPSLSPALLTRARHQDAGPAQPLLHAASVPAVPRPQRLQAFGTWPQVSPCGSQDFTFNLLTPYAEVRLKMCLSGLFALIPRKFLPSCPPAVSGYAEGNSCYSHVLSCIPVCSCRWHLPDSSLSLPPFQRLSTANDEIVEVLLSKHQVLAALRFIRGIGGHDNISARKFLDAAKQTEDNMLFYTIFRFFEQRNQRLRGNPNFTPGEDVVGVKRAG